MERLDKSIRMCYLIEAAYGGFGERFDTRISREASDTPIIKRRGNRTELGQGGP